MIFAALNEAADRGELRLIECGLCRYHKRRDGTVVIRELIVLPCCRGRGRGKALVQEIQHLGLPLLVRCPADYPSNGFWRHIGFELAESGKVNVWRWHPPSSTAPTAIQPSPA